MSTELMDFSDNLIDPVTYINKCPGVFERQYVYIKFFKILGKLKFIETSNIYKRIISHFEREIEETGYP